MVRPGPAAAAGRPPLRHRWKHFVFDGQSEKDRFGVFDPFLRTMYVFGVALGATLAIVSIGEGAGPSSGGAPPAMAGGVAILALVGGGLLYKAIWRTPSEREILLQMAREEDEALRMRARLEEGARGVKKG